MRYDQLTARVMYLDEKLQQTLFKNQELKDKVEILERRLRPLGSLAEKILIPQSPQFSADSHHHQIPVWYQNQLNSRPDHHK
jgi:hypothetical protein